MAQSRCFYYTPDGRFAYSGKQGNKSDSAQLAPEFLKEVTHGMEMLFSAQVEEKAACHSANEKNQAEFQQLLAYFTHKISLLKILSVMLSVLYNFPATITTKIVENGQKFPAARFWGTNLGVLCSRVLSLLGMCSTGRGAYTVDKLSVVSVCQFIFLFAVLMEAIKSFFTSMHCSKIARSSWYLPSSSSSSQYSLSEQYFSAICSLWFLFSS